MTLTASQIANDGAALAKVSYNNSGTVSYNVSDTGANITTYLSQLEANGTIGTITVNDNTPIVVSYAQISSDSGALNKIVDANSSPYTLTVSDTAANIQSALIAGTTNSHIAMIEISNNGTITLNASQAVSNATALGELYNSTGATRATVTVNDTASNIQSNLSGLNASAIHIGKIVVSNSGSAEVQVSVAGLTSYSNVLVELYNSNGSTAANVTVSDTASDITGGLATLESDTQVNKIIVSDSGANEVVVSVSGLTTYGTVLSSLFDANGSTAANVTVSDTTANVTAAIETLGGNAQVNKIELTDGNAVTLSVATFGNAATTTALAELYGENASLATVTISDTAANITSDLATLNGDSQVTKLVVNNNGLVSFTVAQLTTYSTAIGELYNSNGTTPASLEVLDTASNISTAFDTLNGASRVTKIVISSGTVTILAASAANDATRVERALSCERNVAGDGRRVRRRYKRSIQSQCARNQPLLHRVDHTHRRFHADHRGHIDPVHERRHDSERHHLRL